MATALNETELRGRLSSSDAIQGEGFAILKSLSFFLNPDGPVAIGRELLLRALERRQEFGTLSPVLDALSRAAGFYPYANPDSLDLRDSIAYEFHRPTGMPPDIVFHQEQAEVYRRLLAGDSVILSAPTSFGKSRIIDAIVATGKHQNIAVIVPTLALIDETRRRLSTFAAQYKIISHLAQRPADRNIFVFTPERAVTFENLPKISFFAIDEFYKLGAMEEDPNRTVALNEAFYRLRRGGGQFYLLGPNIQHIPKGLEEAFKCFFYPTTFSTVVVETATAPGKGKNIERLISLLSTLKEPTLIYCSSPARVNEVARAMVAANLGNAQSELSDAASWIGATYHPEWIFGTGLLRGIGIHHGRLPRSLAQFVVRAFNDERIQFLICTSTLIEGVNTKAKNVVVWDNEIGGRALDFFTFNNIKGRSGRMFQHFIGRVFLFDAPPQEDLPFVDFPLFTQDRNTPDSLLIQLEPPDLTEHSRDRIKKYREQQLLSLETIRANRSVDPAAQLKFAVHIDENATTIWPKLAWRSFPGDYEQLKFLCELIWKYLVEANRSQGVFSGSQLAFKTWQLFQTKSTAKRVLSELRPGKYVAKSPDEAVERVLQFERNWAGFELPKLLMAASRIQNEVLSRKGLPSGDYALFAAQAESLFRTPVLAALDEYGVPLPLAERIQANLRTKDDLDIALENLKGLKLNLLRLSAFERELLADAQSGL